MFIKEVPIILQWAEKNLRNFSWRKNPTPYRILVAEILLRRTTASAVEKMYDGFIKKYSDLITLSKTPEEILQSELKRLGYNKIRSKILIEISKELLLKYGGIPDSLEYLLATRHIGLYIASAILSLAYGKPLPMVDSNVIRILHRYHGKQFSQVECFNILKGILPENFRIFNLALLDFGSLVCKPQHPLCISCPLKNCCEYGKNI